VKGKRNNVNGSQSRNLTEDFIEVWSEYKTRSSMWRNLVEKVNAKKRELTRIIFWENGMYPHFSMMGGLSYG
jgi:hypothetical protein